MHRLVAMVERLKNPSKRLLRLSCDFLCLTVSVLKTLQSASVYARWLLGLRHQASPLVCRAGLLDCSNWIARRSLSFQAGPGAHYDHLAGLRMFIRGSPTWFVARDTSSATVEEFLAHPDLWVRFSNSLLLRSLQSKPYYRGFLFRLGIHQ